MDGIYETATIESPLKPKPFAELFRQHGHQTSSAEKNVVDNDSPLMPKPIEEFRRMLYPIQEKQIETDNLKISKKSIVQKNEQKSIKFKVPIKVSRAMCHNNGNSNFRNSLFQAKIKRGTTICNGNGIPTNLSPDKIRQKVRKVLFSGTDSPTVPYRNHKIIKTKNSLISEASHNEIQKRTSSNITGKSTLDTQKIPGRTTKLIHMLQKRDDPEKLFSTSMEDFELAETICVIPSPSNISQDWERMIKLQSKLTSLSTEIGAVSTEINKLWQQIQSNFNKRNNKAIGKRVRSPFMKVGSINGNNLRKSTLLKTVREIPTNTIEEPATSPNAADDENVKEAEPLDLKMTESISMYNAIRGHVLRTPKASRQSLERGDSISTTIQKQCLLLMDTPKL